MSSVETFRRVASLLRSWGVEVVEVPGWQTRGSGVLRLASQSALWIWHHTAGSRRAGATASLRICTFGRPGLANALCNWYVPRIAAGASLRLYLVAADAAWHAGRGVLGTNGRMGGTEAENDGVGEPWTAEEYRAQVLLAAALSIVLGRQGHYDHLEHAPARKSDRKVAGAFRGPAQFRADVAAMVAAGGPLHAPVFEEDELDMDDAHFQQLVRSTPMYDGDDPDSVPEPLVNYLHDTRTAAFAAADRAVAIEAKLDRVLARLDATA